MFLIDILVEASKEAKLKLDEEERRKVKRQDHETCMNQLQAEPMNAPKRERSKRNIKRLKTDVSHVQEASDDIYMPELEAAEDSSDDDDDDDDEIKKISKKKGKRIKAKRINAMADCGPIPPPALPQEFKKRMLLKAEAKGGVLGEAVLVIQKPLTMTDIQSQQNRFSIPESQILNTFLTENELSFLKGRTEGGNCNTMIVDIIEPSGLVKKVSLSRWEMPKDKGPVSVSFVLKGDWKLVVSNNRLQKGDMVQLWAFRIEGKLCFAFVILSDEEEEQQRNSNCVGNTSASCVCTDNNEAKASSSTGADQFDQEQE